LSWLYPGAAMRPSDGDGVTDLVKPGSDGGLAHDGLVVDDVDGLAGGSTWTLGHPREGGELGFDGVLAVVAADVGATRVSSGIVVVLR